MEILLASGTTSTPGSVIEGRPITQFKVKTYSFRWTLDSFSNNCKVTGEPVLSPTFPSGDNSGPKWCLVLYPHGSNEESKNYLSLYLKLISSNTTEVTAKFIFAILKSEVQSNVYFFAVCKFKTDARVIGKSKCLQRNLLLEGGSFLPGDKLTICCGQSVFVDTINISGQNIRVPECPWSYEFGKFLRSQTLADVTLVSSDNRELAAHKAILAARSTVFFNMFQYELKESMIDKVDITDMDHEMLQEMLNYIYTGLASKMEKRPKDLLMIADKYALDHLKVMCEDCLLKRLDVANAVEVLIVADAHNAEILNEGAIDFINMHSPDVLYTDGWRVLEQTQPRLVAEIFQDLAAELPHVNQPR